MSAAKYAFGFISVVLFASAVTAYFRPTDDAASVAVPIALTVCGLLAAVIALNADRLLRRRSKAREGNDVGDTSIPRRGSKQDDPDVDCDD